MGRSGRAVHGGVVGKRQPASRRAGCPGAGMLESSHQVLGPVPHPASPSAQPASFHGVDPQEHLNKLLHTKAKSKTKPEKFYWPPIEFSIKKIFFNKGPTTLPTCSDPYLHFSPHITEVFLASLTKLSMSQSP